MQALLKTKRQRMWTVICLATAGCLIFALFSLLVTSNYFITSAVKIVLFISFPLFYFLILEKGTMSSLFLNANKKHLRILFLLGGAAFVFIIVGFIFLRGFLDKEIILAKILDNNITSFTYPVVFVYIVVINAFLEEFFFRGFVFLNLKRLANTWLAQLVSATMFALYHVTIVVGAVDLPMLILMLAGLLGAGLLFNEVTRRCNNIWGSLIIHILANIALNSIVAYYFYFT